MIDGPLVNDDGRDRRGWHIDLTNLASPRRPSPQVKSPATVPTLAAYQAICSAAGKSVPSTKYPSNVARSYCEASSSSAVYQPAPALYVNSLQALGVTMANIILYHGNDIDCEAHAGPYPAQGDGQSIPAMRAFSSDTDTPQPDCDIGTSSNAYCREAGSTAKTHHVYLCL